MKLNKTIKELRLKKGLTQEQIACYLGVSTPAVNKWEKGNTYPDITLLPALARLLGTDLNTLLSFKDDLTNLEISNFADKIFEDASENGIDHAFEIAMNKIHEYPNCDQLTLAVASSLSAIIKIFESKNDTKVYEDKIESLYNRVINSDDVNIANLTKIMFISKYIENGSHDKAEELLNQLPDTPNYNKEIFQARLYINQNKLQEAANIIEPSLMGKISQIQSYLYMLMEIAKKEGNLSQLESLSKIAIELSTLFELGDINTYSVKLCCCTIKEDSSGVIENAKKMINIIEERDLVQLPQSLCSHIENKIKDNQHNNYNKSWIQAIISDLTDKNKHEYDFLRDTSEFNEFLDWAQSKMK